ncbi:DNA-binding response regulator [Clostridium sp. AF19-22AC]|uniref:response regulator transcription factor n=1 Tax=Clostridia TaxID=186801 RepID=UPI000E4C6128|nr:MULTISPECIES: response regulator transcription factor [Clostridia]RHR28613.1 DNA-binding response regulator [Clostridium sp. AF19-22AC]
MKGKVVLMVEDNEHVQELNRLVLEREGCMVLTAPSLDAARQILAGHPVIDIVVLDILLPDGSGLDFIPELKKSTAAPVLMLTSRRGYGDMVQGLTGGADDYMTKPYRVEELLARMVALLHRRETAQGNIRLTRGPLVLDTVAQRAFLHGEDILLQPREYAVLLYLIRHEGEGVPAEQLFEAVWKLPALGNTNAAKTAVSRLRRKLSGSGYTISSGRGTGYCFERENRNCNR